MLIETQEPRTDFPPATAAMPFRAAPLAPQYRSRPWGRHDGIPAPAAMQPLGEMVFDAADDGLVVKWLQTGRPLPVRFHPQRGPGRNHKWWYVADARPGSWLQLGLKRSAEPEEIARAARDGSLPAMLRRIEPAMGDMFFVEAGTLHALGPGLTVVELRESGAAARQLCGHDRAQEPDPALHQAILDPRPIQPMPNEHAPFRIAQEMIGPEQRVMLMDRRACIAIVEGSGILGNQPYRRHQCWQLNGPLPARAIEPTVMILAEPVEAAGSGAEDRRSRQ